MTPTTQNLKEDANTLFTCEKSLKSSQEPDRYQWFFEPYNAESAQTTYSKDKIITVYNLDLRNSIGHGQILELANLTQNQSGVYICCFFFNKARIVTRSLDYLDEASSSFEENHDRLRNSFDYRCSSGELRVNTSKLIPKVFSFKTKVLIGLIILVSCMIFVVGISFLVYYGYSKYFTYLKTVKAAQTMHKVRSAFCCFSLI